MTISIVDKDRGPVRTLGPGSAAATDSPVKPSWLPLLAAT
jgi:hypothetical protein